MELQGVHSPLPLFNSKNSTAKRKLATYNSTGSTAYQKCGEKLYGKL
jgi:hypothetical protein